MLNLEIRGIVSAMATCLTPAGEINPEATIQLCDFLIERGVNALFPIGTTGEGFLLKTSERKALAEIIVEAVAGRVPVIIQTGAMSTALTVELTRHAQTIGADAAGIITPYFYSFDDLSLRRHFLEVAQAVPDFPLFLYNFPANAGNIISPKLLADLHEKAPNIVGLKNSDGDLTVFQDFVEMGDFIILNGHDGLMLPALAIGSKGQVSGNSTAFPEPFVALYQAWQKGDIDEARSHQRFINRLRDATMDTRYLAVVKRALEWRGIPAGPVRSPQRELTPDEERTYRRKLEKLGLL